MFGQQLQDTDIMPSASKSTMADFKMIAQLGEHCR